jgi:hypothetical protein
MGSAALLGTDVARTRWWVRVAIGFGAGVAIAYIDNFAFAGEITPMIIVVLLLAATATSSAVWGVRGCSPALAAWVCVPLAHLVRHFLGLPDTLHPNTYASIMLLGGFTLVVSAIGTGSGLLLRKLGTGITTSG